MTPQAVEAISFLALFPSVEISMVRRTQLIFALEVFPTLGLSQKA
jgi:hypothetical protein